MRTHDALIVFSRPEYSEGLPGTIYEGLTARLPIVMSDHPMFLRYFTDERDALIAPAATPEKLADRLLTLFDDAELYARLSNESAAAFDRIIHPVLWAEMVERWLLDRPEDRAWLKSNTLPNWLT